MEEIWKDIEGYEGCYQISNTGRVKSLDRYVKNSRSDGFLRKGIMKSITSDSDGYMQVGLNKKGSLKTIKVHRLVAQFFIPNPENKPCVNHINGVKTDNRVDNLEWVTVLENNIHAFDIGLKKGMKGEKATNAKLTEKQAKEIKYGHKGLRQWEVAEIYGICHQQVSSIRNGIVWTHI